MTGRRETPSSPALRWVRRAPGGIRPWQERGRLGVLGGTFNPVTCAHLTLAATAAERAALDEVLFILPEVLPHRAPEDASVEERQALLEAALADSPHFSLALCSHGLLLDMARAVAPAYPPATKLFFLLGSDAAARILGWDYPDREKAWTEMFARFDLIVARRGGPLRLESLPLKTAYQNQIHDLELPAGTASISATAVRERVRAGQPIEKLVPAGVADAIARAGLYRS